ncbi:aminoglycoside phosphotransferase family protein [Chitinophagaceae bacterium 26-R-25]|nr:aminoglycoside phosphotransferase family protein [Chitinophagaceae bacterium 26-R-25]
MFDVLKHYPINFSRADIQKFGTGLINHTWIVHKGQEKFILQRVNENVFCKPHDIAHNIDCLSSYFHQHYPEYLFVSPVVASNGSSLVEYDGGYYRLFPFVAGSCSVDVVSTPAQAYQAAAQFGKFTRLLNKFDSGKLKTCIPDFHNLSLRYSHFLAALQNGDAQRIRESSALIEFLKNQSGIVSMYEQIIHDENFRIRVTHHDTKISNVLFDEAGNGLCVIDLDTVMAGYFISDVGDMMRTFLSPVSEEENDFDRIEVREEFYHAIVTGYFAEMKDVMTPEEKDSFFYAGLFMIYMQAMRFLTDHLLGDPYYGAKYERHNLVRANNQVVLLQRLLEKQTLLQNKINTSAYA